MNRLLVLRLSLFAILFCGCDLHRQKGGDSKQATASRPDSSLFFQGQSIESVQQILGEPNGTMASGNQTILLYGGESLEFIDRKLINPPPDIQQRIENSKKTLAKQAKAAKSQPKKPASITFPMAKKTQPASQTKPSTTSFSRNQVQVITYRDDQDLLAQLKQIPKGQMIDLRCSSPGWKSTGIKCSDTAAKAAAMKKNREMTDKINAELARINGN